MKYLDSTGLTTLWAKIKNHVSSSIAALSNVYAAISHTHTKSQITDLNDASTSAAGLMTAAMVTKLNGIDAQANKYVLPTAAKDVLGGVKTTSTVTSASGYTAAPIISGVPYYKDTDTKVTSAANHYAPAEDTDAELQAELDGSVTAYALNAEREVVTGIKLQRDAKGHVVGVKATKAKVKDTNTTYGDASTSAKGLMTTAMVIKLNGVAAGAQVNVIEKVKVNGTELTPSSKAVDINIPTDNASLTNGAGYQTAAQVQALIDSSLTSAITPRGSITAANIPTPNAARLGYMYNVTDELNINTTALIDMFVDASSHGTTKYPAGTNIVCVKVGADEYKWDVMAGFVDLSAYALTQDIQSLTTTEIDDICQ